MTMRYTAAGRMAPCVRLLTILGFAGAVVRLQQVTLHTAADVGALGVGARLAAGAVHGALVEICREERQWVSGARGAGEGHQFVFGRNSVALLGNSGAGPPPNPGICINLPPGGRAVVLSGGG